MILTLQGLLTYGSTLLGESGIEEAELDAQYLLYEVFRIDTVSYLMNRSKPLADDEATQRHLDQYYQLLERRSGRVPLQYLLGSQEFMGLTFYVNEHVLIPRQDTETLAEAVLRSHPSKNLSILDMCTGSGCIAVSLKKLGGYYHIDGADVSPEALRVAAANGDRHGCEIGWMESDLFSHIKPGVCRYDIIVSNPPYIPTKVIEGLEPEVRDYEPLLALDGMEDGLYFYRRLADQCRLYLKSGGSVYFEIGYDQGKDVSDLLAAAGYIHIEVIRDEPGLDRVVRADYV